MNRFARLSLFVTALSGMLLATPVAAHDRTRVQAFSVVPSTPAYVHHYYGPPVTIVGAVPWSGDVHTYGPRAYCPPRNHWRNDRHHHGGWPHWRNDFRHRRNGHGDGLSIQFSTGFD
jgi:hypothetical protein